MARTSFLSSHSKSYLHVAADNRIHVWDTLTRLEKRTYVEKNHLAHNYVSFSWKQSVKDNLGLFAVGCSDGVILIWDLVRGVVVQTLGTANESAVASDLAFSADSKSVFVSSTQHNYISEYRLSDGVQVNTYKCGKKGVSKLALNPKVEVIAVASSSIRLIELASKRKRKLDSNFSGGISGVEFSPCGCFLAACGTGTREVLIFDVQASAKSSSPLSVVAVNGVPISLSVRSNDDCIDILCTFEDQSACIIRHGHADETLENDSPTVSICNLNANCAILAARFGVIGSAGSTSGLSVALGSQTRPYFTHINYDDSDGSLEPAVDIASPDATHGATSSSSGNESTANGMTARAAQGLPLPPVVLGPGEMGGVKRPTVEFEGTVTSSKKTKRKVGEESGDGMSGEDAEKTMSWEIEGAQGIIEQTLEQRLESLSASMFEAEERVRRTSVASASGGAGDAIVADSLVTLVEQALQSGDDILLEQCLSCEDDDTIDTTARRLSVGRVVALLKRLMAKFEKRPSRGMLLTKWLFSLLRHHTSYLISVPDLAGHLAALSQMLEQRLASCNRLASLGGRLDLLMHQINTASAATAAVGSSSSVGRSMGSHSTAAPGPSVPANVFQEK